MSTHGQTVSKLTSGAVPPGLDLGYASIAVGLSEGISTVVKERMRWSEFGSRSKHRKTSTPKL